MIFLSILKLSGIERKAGYFSELSNNQQRLSIDIRQTYDAYREARRNAAKYAGGMSWKPLSCCAKSCRT